MEKIRRVLIIDARELYFSAAHWIPNHPQCGILHGHTYFVKDLQVTVEGFVDLGDIKSVIKKFDHLVIVPEVHSLEWVDLVDTIKTEARFEKLRKVFSKSRVIIDTDLPGTTVERIAEELQAELLSILGVVDVHFVLTEGPTAGREI
jgi:6-pyruvoyl-tetrahydropterin synthase